MTIQERILECENKIRSYEDMLKKMPEDTFLGTLCVKAYLKRERRKLEELKSKEAELSND